MEEINQIEVIDLWNIIKKKIKLIICITMGTVVLTGIINYCLIKPVYEVESNIIIGTAPEKSSLTHDSNSIDIYMYQSLMKTYSSIASSQLIINSTVEKLKNTQTKEKILDNISVTVQENTQIMTIKYRSTDPKEAKITLDTLIECFIEQTQKIYPTDSITIIDKVEVPKHPVKPKKIYNLAVAFFLGLTSSVFIAFLLETMDNTIKTEKDIEKYLKIPVIGEISNNIEITTIKNNRTPIWETYRILKNNIEFSSCDKKIHSVAIISSASGEGKTTIAANLAVAFSEGGNSTILLDCNLRNPKLHEIFGLSKVKGLSDFIAEDIGYQQVIKATDIQNLYLIPSGSNIENPSEIIASSKMKNLIEILKEKYDYIIMDTPKVIMLSDTQILSQYCDGCVMIISSSVSKRAAVIKAKELLMKVNTKIIGVVLNKTEVNHKEDNKYFFIKKWHNFKIINGK